MSKISADQVQIEELKDGIRSPGASAAKRVTSARLQIRDAGGMPIAVQLHVLMVKSQLLLQQILSVEQDPPANTQSQTAA
jgi:hypothetical protein